MYVRLYVVTRDWENRPNIHPKPKLSYFDFVLYFSLILFPHSFFLSPPCPIFTVPVISPYFLYSSPSFTLVFFPVHVHVSLFSVLRFSPPFPYIPWFHLPVQVLSLISSPLHTFASFYYILPLSTLPRPLLALSFRVGACRPKMFLSPGQMYKVLTALSYIKG